MAIPHYDWIEHHARRTPDKAAIVDLAVGSRFTYAELHDRIGRLTALLRARGVGPGDRVASLSQNSGRLFELLFACGRAGAVFLPLNWRLTGPELQYVVDDATPALLYATPAFAEAATALGAQCPSLREVVGLDPEALDSELAGLSPAAEIAPRSHDDTQVLMYTSGTTGSPKGALLTFGMAFWNAINLGVPAAITPATVALTVMPMFHTSGLNCYAAPTFHAGGTVLVMEGFDAVRVLAALEDRTLGITHFFGVPFAYEAMAREPGFASADLTHLALAGVGGAAASVPLLRTWEKKGIILQHGYGMTETSPSVTTLALDHAIAKAGSIGTPLMHMEVKIVREDGLEAVTGEAGELWIRGPIVTPGYWNQPEATAAAFSDGWLKSGDVARRDADGFLFIVDRSKDMYISGGENVYPAEVERVLYDIPAIAEAAVIGVADARWGETGLAVLALHPGAALSEEDVLAHCQDRLARYKHPRKVVFMEALPRTSSGKIHKPPLRARFGGGAA
jgi:fatty-acyl-CoA synthase